MGLAVDGAAVVQPIVEVAAVEHHVAGNGGHAGAHRLGHQLGHLLRYQLGVALAAQIDVPDHAVGPRLAVRIERGLPAVAGPQQLQAGEGRDQLHRRSRVHRGLGVPADGRGRGALPDDVEAGRGKRYARLPQAEQHRRRQARLIL